METIITNLPIGILFALLGAFVFAIIGMIPGTSETATIAPVTLLIVLMGAPPVAIFAFFIAGVVSKHLVHSAPTALMGIPGDTMAVPMLEPAGIMRKLGIPHIALQKMVSGGIIASFIAIPVAVGFATLLAPYGKVVASWAGFIFAVVTVVMAYFSAGRWGSLLMIVPLALVMQGFNKMAIAGTGKSLTIAFFSGFPLVPCS